MNKMVLRKSLLLAFLAVALVASPVSAAKPSGGATSTPVGNDISWPQCGKTYPTGQAFGIVGVNGGLATTTNPCLSSQLVWAAQSVGGTKQPKVQLYVNTANPGEIIDRVATWPTDNVDSAGNTTSNPYGPCDGTNTQACSWQYGWNRALEDVRDRFAPAVQAAGLPSAPASYVWWLDVETMNTWQSGSAEALARNAATLEGMTAYFKSLGIHVGAYSTGTQWNQIVGTVAAGSNLNGLDNWRAGARSLKGAKSNCSLTPFTPGSKVTITQYVSGSFDYNYSCVN